MQLKRLGLKDFTRQGIRIALGIKKRFSTKMYKNKLNLNISKALGNGPILLEM